MALICVVHEHTIRRIFASFTNNVGLERWYQDWSDRIIFASETFQSSFLIRFPSSSIIRMHNIHPYNIQRKTKGGQRYVVCMSTCMDFVWIWYASDFIVDIWCFWFLIWHLSDSMILYDMRLTVLLLYCREGDRHSPTAKRMGQGMEERARGSKRKRFIHTLAAFAALNPINCYLISIAWNGIISVYLAPNMYERRQQELVSVYKLLFVVALVSEMRN